MSAYSVRLLWLFRVSAALATALSLAHAEDPCAAFTWDVRHERALFGRKPQPLTGGATVSGAPLLAADRLYQLKLRAQSEVKLLEVPGKKPVDSGAYGGLASLKVDTTGVYRIALDQRLWVDVIVNGTVMAAKDFQGRPGCNAPHKIVEFMLPAQTPVTLQFSGASAPAVKVTVTPAPTPTS